MQYRSWLLVPGDNEEMLGGAGATGADVVVVDLEEGVAPDAKNAARARTVEWLNIHRKQIIEHRRVGRWVRINAMETRVWRDDLLAIMPGRPEGIILPKSTGPDDVQHLGAELYELEQRNQIPTGTTRILPQVGATALSALGIDGYITASLPRLAGLTWNARALARAIGARAMHDGQGAWNDPSRHVRLHALLAAHARGILAIETFQTDGKAVKQAAEAARGDGFSGMMALKADHIAAINAAFNPGSEDVAEARSVVAAFERSPSVHTVQIEGQTFDTGHLRLARRMLGLEETGHEGGFAGMGAPILRSA